MLANDQHRSKSAKVDAAGEIGALSRRAGALHRAGRLDEALIAYDEWAALAPRDANLLNNRGIAFAQMGRATAAQDSYERALSIDACHPGAQVNLGIIYGEQGRLNDALTCFEAALATQPGHPVALANRAATLRALQTDRTDADRDALVTEALALGTAGKHADALAIFDRLHDVDPDDALVLFYRGVALFGLDRCEESLAAFDAALVHGSNDLALHVNRAAVATRLGRLEEAVRSYDAALLIDLGHLDFQRSRAEALWALGLTRDALDAFEQILARHPADEIALNGAGRANLGLGFPDQALTYFDRAIVAHPDRPSAHSHRGEALAELKRFPEAVESLSNALAADPTARFIQGQLLHLRMRLADWSEFEDRRDDLIAAARSGAAVAMPFTLLALTDDPAVHRTAATTFAKSFRSATSANTAGYVNERIRIGYFSSDFHDHATMFLMAEMIEAHDRRDFEWFGFSFGAGLEQAMRHRAAAAFDHFLDVRSAGPAQIAALSREHRIDIAVDLKGLTAQCRPEIFGARAAPIQANYLGYPGSMPNTNMDYLIADATVITAAERDAIAESIVYLPGCYQPNCRNSSIGATPRRRDVGLPDTGFVFVCFNQSYKILPEVFECWMRILASVEGSVLWLWAKEPVVRDNLRRTAVSLGIAPERICFADTLPRPEHLGRIALADLFLDTLPYNAHTTASDALRMGVPVVTCRGRSFAARVATSLLTTLGLEELAVDSLAAYEALAIRLAQDPDRIAALSAKLTVATSPLFDATDHARKLEEGYRRMLTRHRTGLNPADIRW